MALMKAGVSGRIWHSGKLSSKMLPKFLNGPISTCPFNSSFALLLAHSILAAKGEEGIVGQRDGLNEGRREVGESDILVSDV